MSRYYGRYSPYVPVAERRRIAAKKMAKLTKTGQDIQPITIEGRTIARSFWGKGWCTHVESFNDYSNRLPRGRTYTRNGSVCHLDIQKGSVKAIVSGSSLYNIVIDISPLKPSVWKTLQKRCQGKIGSLIELLNGRLSDEIMGHVTDPKNGLFPASKEISYNCDCPDWASMCKHVAAVIYGIGARLDTRPELLFLLRGVDHQDLITEQTATDAIAGAVSGNGGKRRRALTGSNLGDVFGVDLDVDAGDTAPAPKRRSPKKKTTVARKTPSTKATKLTPKKPAATKRKAFTPTGASVTRLRKSLGMTKAAFARAVGVSAPTIGNWESAKGRIYPQPRCLEGLVRLHEQANAAGSQ